MPLVLSRREGERVTLIRNGEVLGTVRVKDIDRGKTRLVLDFPKDVTIKRDELLHDGDVKGGEG